MTLYKQGTISYHYGAERNTYLFTPLNNSDELKKFMISLQNFCGEIWFIIVKKYFGTNDNKVMLYEKYDALLVFLEKFGLQDIKEFNTYEFLGIDPNCKFKMHCKIDTIKNILDIYKSDYTAEPEEGSYTYYKFENGIIVRLNTEGSGCHFLTNDNRWKLDYSYEDWIYDAAYKYVEISDPLNGMADMYEHQYAQNVAQRMKHYNQLAYEIKIVET
ncbi:MAG: hypothetical protein NC452_02445 [Eubacterium sp.]|nr:hypothetical protein [Eubacterium sp.]